MILLRLPQFHCNLNPIELICGKKVHFKKQWEPVKVRGKIIRRRLIIKSNALEMRWRKSNTVLFSEEISIAKSWLLCDIVPCFLTFQSILLFVWTLLDLVLSKSLDKPRTHDGVHISFMPTMFTVL